MQPPKRTDRRRLGRRCQPENDRAQHREYQDRERKERAQQHLENFQPLPSSRANKGWPARLCRRQLRPRTRPVLARRPWSAVAASGVFSATAGLRCFGWFRWLRRRLAGRSLFGLGRWLRQSGTGFCGLGRWLLQSGGVFFAPRSAREFARFVDGARRASRTRFDQPGGIDFHVRCCRQPPRHAQQRNDKQGRHQA